VKLPAGNPPCASALGPSLAALLLIFGDLSGFHTAAAQSTTSVCIPRGTATNWTGDYGYCAGAPEPPQASQAAQTAEQARLIRLEVEAAVRAGALERAQTLRSMNDRGIAAYKHGKWVLAAQYFEAAVRLDPDNPVWRANLQKARDMQARGAPAPRSVVTGQGLRDAVSANSDGTRRASQGAPAASPAPPNATSRPSTSAPAAPSGGLSFLPAGSSAVFQTTTNPSDPGLTPLPADPTTTVKSAAEQASSISKSALEAAHARNNPEEAKAPSGYGFDDRPHSPPDSIKVAPAKSTPSTTELLSHIPMEDDAVRLDVVIQRSIAWYRTLDVQVAEAKGRVAEIERQIGERKDAPDVLRAKLGTAQNDVANLQKHEAEAEAAIRKELLSINLKWIVAPTPSKAPNQQGERKGEGP